MKQLSVLFLLLCAASAVQAQDVIVKKDGSTILSKVLEVNTADVKYKKFSNQQGPTYTINISDILSINYENGEKDDFKGENPSAPAASAENASSGSSQLINKPADARNAELVAMYNHEHHSTGKWKGDGSPAKCGYVIYWVSPTSIISTDELEMSFGEQTYKAKEGFANVWFKYNTIVLKNKTDKFIYIDLANTFRNYSTGEVRCYYDTEQTTVSQNSSSGGSIGVGGLVGSAVGNIAVGAGTSGIVSKTYTTQRVISIPPHGQRNLSEYKRVQVKGGKYETISKAEDFSDIEMGLKGQIMAGEVNYDESESPFTIDYTITYSTSESFATYSTLHAKLFLRTVIGSKHSVQHMHKHDKYVTDVDANTLIGSHFDL